MMIGFSLADTITGTLKHNIGIHLLHYHNHKEKKYIIS